MTPKKQMREGAVLAQEGAIVGLLEPVPWQLMAALTTPRSMSQTWWDSAVSNWLAEAQRAHRSTIGSLWSFEHDPRLHAHLLLAAATKLSVARLSRLWLQSIGTTSTSHALIEPYDARRGGLRYSTKTFGGERDQVDWSWNIRFFLKLHPDRVLNSQQRRQLRRIREQYAKTEGRNSAHSLLLHS